MCKSVKLRIGIAAGLFAALTPPAAACDWVYQASFLTLPPAQSWPFDGSTQAGATAASGVLKYGPTTTSGTTFWGISVPGSGMDFSKVTWTLSARVRLTGATFGSVSGYRRGGFVLYLGDSAGHWITCDLGSSAGGIRNDDFGTSDPSFLSDFSSGFRTISLEAGPGGGRLLVDGSPALSLSFGSGGNTNAAYFGEASILASAQLTEIEWVTLVPSVQSCPADFNCDVVVDDLDFLIFVQAYNILVCDDPGMPLTCPADINHDGFVDDADFTLFASAYNELVRP